MRSAFFFLSLSIFSRSCALVTLAPPLPTARPPTLKSWSTILPSPTTRLSSRTRPTPRSHTNSGNRIERAPPRRPTPTPSTPGMAPAAATKKKQDEHTAADYYFDSYSHYGEGEDGRGEAGQGGWRGMWPIRARPARGRARFFFFFY